jgi:hypothetical protein
MRDKTKAPGPGPRKRGASAADHDSGNDMALRDIGLPLRRDTGVVGPSDVRAERECLRAQSGTCIRSLGIGRIISLW